MSEDFFNLEKYKKRGEFKLRSGKITKIYWDFRPLLVNYKDLKLLMDFYLDNLWKGMESTENGLNVIGMELWGAVFAPLLDLLSSNPNVSYNPLILRKKKEYGVRQRLIGEINQKFKTVLLDDLVFTGDTLDDAVKFLNEQEIKVDKILVLINNSKAKEINSIPIDSVFQIMK